MHAPRVAPIGHPDTNWHVSKSNVGFASLSRYSTRPPHKTGAGGNFGAQTNGNRPARAARHRLGAMPARTGEDLVNPILKKKIVY